MNPDSRKKGGGGRRRIVEAPGRTPKPSKPKRKTYDEGEPLRPVELAAKPSELLQKARAEALSGLSELVGLAVATLSSCLINGPTRAQGSRSSDARYVLDVLFDRITAPAATPEDTELDEEGNPAPTPIDELAVRRAELQKYLRQQRKDAERDRRK